MAKYEKYELNNGKIYQVPGVIQLVVKYLIPGSFQRRSECIQKIVYKENYVLWQLKVNLKGYQLSIDINDIA